MKKISLKDNNKALSRNEMRIITGGDHLLIKYPGVTPSCGEECSSDSFCSGNSSCSKCTSGKCA